MFVSLTDLPFIMVKMIRSIANGTLTRVSRRLFIAIAG